jgi:hypothetical protein
MSIEAMKQALEAFELGSAGPEKLRAMNALRQAIEQAEQAQPFGYFRYDLRLDAWVHSLDRNQGVAFYTAPPQRKPLTDEEIKECERKSMVNGALPFEQRWFFARAIEAAHGIKEKHT